MRTRCARRPGSRAGPSSMARKTFFLLFLSLAAASTLLAASAAPPEDRPRIVALGDSLTSGRGIGVADAYPAVLQERLDDSGYQYRVVNAGVSGDTSSRALRRCREALD